MTQGLRWTALGLATVVNLAALAAVNASMIQVAEREMVALHQPPRIVVTGTPARHAVLARQSCPGSGVL
jgi:hypothetical protein